MATSTPRFALSLRALGNGEGKRGAETGIQAYIYAYPLIMIGQMLGVSTNVATPEGTSAPMGQFAHVREYPTPEYKTLSSGNLDTKTSRD
jgi:hypothetical protein